MLGMLAKICNNPFNGSGSLRGILTQVIVNGSIILGDPSEPTEVKGITKVNGNIKAENVVFFDTCQVNGNMTTKKSVFKAPLFIWGGANFEGCIFEQTVEIKGSIIELTNCKGSHIEIEPANIFCRVPRVYLKNNTQISSIKFKKKGEVYVDKLSSVENIENGELKKI